MAGQHFEYEYDEIVLPSSGPAKWLCSKGGSGNRVKTREGHDTTGFYAREIVWNANKLNQYESRTVPGKVDLRGTASEDANVLVAGRPATTQAIPTPKDGLQVL